MHCMPLYGNVHLLLQTIRARFGLKSMDMDDIFLAPGS